MRGETPLTAVARSAGNLEGYDDPITGAGGADRVSGFNDFRDELVSKADRTRHREAAVSHRAIDIAQGDREGPNQRLARPLDPAALNLARERLLLYDDSYGKIPELLWLREADLAGAVWMRTASTRALLRAAVSGARIALLPDVFAARETLVAIPAPRPIPPRPPWLLVHRDLRALAPIRAVSAWVVATFAALIGRPR